MLILALSQACWSYGFDRAPPWWERSSRCLPVHLQQRRLYVVSIVVASLLASRMYEPSRRVHVFFVFRRAWQHCQSPPESCLFFFLPLFFLWSSIACCRSHGCYHPIIVSPSASRQVRRLELPATVEPLIQAHDHVHDLHVHPCRIINDAAYYS